MKTLSTEQQVELQELIQSMHDHFPDAYPSIVKADLAYWAIELKPKRVRRREKVLDTETEVV